MTTLDTKFAQKAYDLIQTYGVACTLTQTTSTHSATTLSTTDVTTDYTTKVIMDDLRNKFKDEARKGTRAMYMPAQSLGTTPEPGDKVTVGTDVFKVLEVIPTFPSELAILYELRVAK